MLRVVVVCASASSMCPRSRSSAFRSSSFDVGSQPLAVGWLSQFIVATPHHLEWRDRDSSNVTRARPWVAASAASIRDGGVGVFPPSLIVTTPESNEVLLLGGGQGQGQEEEEEEDFGITGIFAMARPIDTTALSARKTHGPSSSDDAQSHQNERIAVATATDLRVVVVLAASNSSKKTNATAEVVDPTLPTEPLALSSDASEVLALFADDVFSYDVETWRRRKVRVQGQDYDSAVKGCRSLLVADADGDGDSDLFVHCDRSLRLLKRSEDGRYELTYVGVGLPTTTCALAKGDVDEDGLPDLVAACEMRDVQKRDDHASFVSWFKYDFLNDQFAEYRLQRDVPGSRPHIALGDFDGDGHLDIVACFTRDHHSHGQGLCLVSHNECFVDEKDDDPPVEPPSPTPAPSSLKPSSPLKPATKPSSSSSSRRGPRIRSEDYVFLVVIVALTCVVVPVAYRCGQRRQPALENGDDTRRPLQPVDRPDGWEIQDPGGIDADAQRRLFWPRIWTRRQTTPPQTSL